LDPNHQNYVLLYLLTTENVRKLIQCTMAERAIPPEYTAEWKSLDLVTLLLDRSRVQPVDTSQDSMVSEKVAVQVRVVSEIKPRLEELLAPVLVREGQSRDSKQFSRIQQLASMRLCNQLFVALHPPPPTVETATAESAMSASHEAMQIAQRMQDEARNTVVTGMVRHCVELGKELMRLKLVPSLVEQLRWASKPACNLLLCHLQRTLLQVLNLKELFIMAENVSTSGDSDRNSELMLVVHELGKGCLLELIKLLPLLPPLSHDGRAVGITMGDVCSRMLEEAPADETSGKNANVGRGSAQVGKSAAFSGEVAWLQTAVGPEAWKRWKEFKVRAPHYTLLRFSCTLI
jgi:hypothetical protein